MIYHFLSTQKSACGYKNTDPLSEFEIDYNELIETLELISRIRSLCESSKVFGAFRRSVQTIHSKSTSRVSMIPSFFSSEPIILTTPYYGTAFQSKQKHSCCHTVELTKLYIKDILE